MDEKGSLDKATVIARLEEAGEGNYDTVRSSPARRHRAPRAHLDIPVSRSRSERPSRPSTSTRAVAWSSRTGSQYVSPRFAHAQRTSSQGRFLPTQLVTALRESSGPLLAHKGGKVTVKGTVGSNAQHTMVDDEKASFTNHINGVSLPSRIMTEGVALIRLRRARSSLETRTSAISCPFLNTPCSSSTSAEVSSLFDF